MSHHSRCWVLFFVSYCVALFSIFNINMRGYNSLYLLTWSWFTIFIKYYYFLVSSENFFLFLPQFQLPIHFWASTSRTTFQTSIFYLIWMPYRLAEEVHHSITPALKTKSIRRKFNIIVIMNRMIETFLAGKVPLLPRVNQ